ncbi:hypothetical protein, partial [Salmonella sp. SAL4356]|uniref:hypothetical protein n=1 Tax=Salmonella sp. SAL4356 TaxID=3159877 RepID=UPI00397C42F6
MAEGTFSGVATLEVVPGQIDTLVLGPERARAKAGESVSFRARGTDAHGNDVGDVTSRATFSITAPGVCT